MQTDTLTLLPGTPGVRHQLTVHRFGTPGRGPKATIQAALHADEIPALLVAQRLKQALQTLEAEGRVLGEVVLLPFANPIGLAQQALGQHQGRFDLRDGVNFNRAYADLGRAVVPALEGRLGGDAGANTRTIRQALLAAAQALPATTPTEDLKRQLLALAVDADVVLDLHCDAEASLHLYALTPQAALAEELGALMGARAILLATESGEHPFDEACSAPWLRVQQAYPQAAVPLACFSTTVELRGQADTHHGRAEQDAQALLAFLQRRGVLAPAPGSALPTLPDPLCEATPLAASETITAPAAGVLVFHREPGCTVAAGEVVADLVCVETGQVQPLCSGSAGVLYARMATRWAWPGTRVAKVAGRTLMRSGPLLGP
jgi:predicted deacylase